MFKYRTLKELGVISCTSCNALRKKQVRIIQYGNTAPVFDIRLWTAAKDGAERLLKGITLNAHEMRQLKSIIAGIDNPETMLADALKN